MKNFIKQLPIIILILFEFAAGIMLFVNPDAFTAIIIRVFGGILLAVGIVHLIHYIKEKREGASGALTLTLTVITLLLGLVFLIFPGTIQKLFPFLAFVYGLILIITGIYRIGLYIDYKKEQTPVNFMHLISGILAVGLGVLIMFNPGKTVEVMWIVTGILLIVEAFADIASLVLLAVLKKKVEGKPEATGVVSE